MKLTVTRPDAPEGIRWICKRTGNEMKIVNRHARYLIRRWNGREWRTHSVYISMHTAQARLQMEAHPVLSEANQDADECYMCRDWIDKSICSRCGGRDS
jgi:hypothetical protein